MKRILGFVVMALLLAGNVLAQSKDNTGSKNEGCFLGTQSACALKFDVDWGIGLGGTIDSEHGNGTPHLGGWFTTLKIRKASYVRLAGIGLVFDFYDFANHSDPIRTLSRSDDSGYYMTPVWTFIPVQFGPIFYQFSFDGDVQSFGLNRGRLHMISVDFYKLFTMD